MMTPRCSKCQRTIPSDDVNVANDVAFCRVCNVAHKLSSLVQGVQLDSVDVNSPPAGAWHRSSGLTTLIGASHRSLGMALGLLAISLFWNGIVSVFVLFAVSSTLRHMGVTVPGWFPGPNMNGSEMGVGMTIFLWIFLTPFIVIGSAMIAGFVSTLAGHTEVRIRGSEGVIFNGIGSLGWSRRFDADQVKDVRIENERWRDSDGDRRSKTYILIETHEGKPMKFGSMLREERMKFVAAAVRKALLR